jgi:triacylglycerol esterase/lipase EstA (alpha/beta hydrolase family)
MKLSTEVMHRVCATPKTTLVTLLNLTSSVRCYRLKRAAIAVSSLRRIQLMGALYVLTAITSITSISTATAKSYSIDHLKLYAHSRILDYKEFQCFNKIITKESRWSYTAKNGSHFGLGQMKSKHYRDLDPYRQIDASLRYITIRYQTSCKAWAFHQKRNYY